MSQLIGLFSLLMVFCGWPAGVNGADLATPSAVFAYAVELESSGDHQRAATEFGRYVAAARGGEVGAFPQTEEAMYRQAVNLSQTQEVDAALRAFAELGGAFPQSRFIPMALFRIGQVYEQHGAVAEAGQRYRSLIAMGMETELSALSRLRLAWMSLGKPGEEEVARHHLLAVTHPAYTERAKGMLQEVDRLPTLPYKSPWFSGTVSALLPGAGHLYLGRPRDAGFALLSNGLLLTGTIQAFAKGISGLGAALAVGELGLYSGTIFSAVSLTHKHNQMLRDEQIERMKIFVKPDMGAVGLEMKWPY